MLGNESIELSVCTFYLGNLIVTILLSFFLLTDSCYDPLFLKQRPINISTIVSSCILHIMCSITRHRCSLFLQSDMPSKKKGNEDSATTFDPQPSVPCSTMSTTREIKAAATRIIKVSCVLESIRKQLKRPNHIGDLGKTLTLNLAQILQRHSLSVYWPQILSSFQLGPIPSTPTKVISRYYSLFAGWLRGTRTLRSKDMHVFDIF